MEQKERKEKMFIGEKCVKEVTDLPERTPAGSPIHEIFFEDGTKTTMPHERFVTVKTDYVSSSSAVLREISKKLSTQIYSCMHEFDLTMEEIDPVLNEVVRLVNSGATKASNLLWGVEDAPLRSLLMINKVLVKNLDHEPKTDGADGATPAGGVVDPPNP